jgi:23S rRNA (guanine745-N1)-methyltransferase
MLLCTVRDCRLPLERRDRQWTCARGHSFDTSRRGYVNLLQPQDRRSKHPGDSAEAVAARRRLHDRGVTQPLLDGILKITLPQWNDVVLDVGCGDGFYLGELAAQLGCEAHGVDISTPAIEAAAKRYPKCEWVVANADRFLPYADESISLALSITGRMNPAEFHRVLRTGGRALVGLPAPDDLIEVRKVARERFLRTISDFSPLFQLIKTSRATSVADLDAEGTADALLAIYRPMRAEPLGPMRITLSLDLLLFQKL